LKNNKQKYSFLRALPSLNEGNAFLIIVLLLICFIGYLNTGSETSIIQAEEIAHCSTPIEIIEESGNDLKSASCGTADVTFYFEKRTESGDDTNHPDVVLTSGHNKGSPEHSIFLT